MSTTTTTHFTAGIQAGQPVEVGQPTERGFLPVRANGRLTNIVCGNIAAARNLFHMLTGIEAGSVPQATSAAQVTSAVRDQDDQDRVLHNLMCDHCNAEVNVRADGTLHVQCDDDTAFIIPAFPQHDEDWRAA